MAKKPQSALLNGGPGFRIRENIDRPDPELMAAFAEFVTPDISDMQNRLYTMTCEIHNRINNDKVVGPAVTVKVFPGDNLMVHKAIDVVQPGDVVVIDTSSSHMTAVMGDLIAQKMQHRGVAAVIIDGLIRDVDDMKEVGLPVWARGITPIGPLHRGPGELNFPVSCGGIVINPGDIICADESGVVVVRQDFAGEILSRLQAKAKSMVDYTASVKRGDFSNAWVDGLLEELGCEKGY